MPGPLHPKLKIPEFIHQGDLINNTSKYFPILYNDMIKLYDELDKLKEELQNKK